MRFVDMLRSEGVELKLDGERVLHRPAKLSDELRDFVAQNRPAIRAELIAEAAAKPATRAPEPPSVPARPMEQAELGNFDAFARSIRGPRSYR